MGAQPQHDVTAPPKVQVWVQNPDQEWIDRHRKMNKVRHWPWAQRIVDWLWRVKKG